MPPQREHRHDGVDDEQHDRRPERRGSTMGCASGSPFQLGIDGIRNSPIASPSTPKAMKLDAAIDRAAAAGEEREAEHEQQVADDGAGQRAAHDLRQPLVHRDQRDDQLRRVAERRVEEAADPRPGVLRRVLGRLADQPGERDQRDRREHELRVDEVGEVVERDAIGARGDRRRGCGVSRPRTLGGRRVERARPGGPLRRSSRREGGRPDNRDCVRCQVLRGRRGGATIRR